MGKPRTRHMCICLQLSGARGVDNRGVRHREWAMGKKGIPEGLVRSVMSLYEVAKTMVLVDSELEEFEVKVGMHQGSVLSPFRFALVVDVVTVFARGCV